MRLINYEEYKNKLLKVRDSIPLTVPAASYELMLEKPYTHGMSMRGGIRKALKCLEECQNVSDVAPVKRGRWLYKHRHRGGFRTYEGYDEFGEKHSVRVDERYEIDEPYCSECGKWNESVWLNYCPNCGAKMDGGKKDG